MVASLLRRPGVQHTFLLIVLLAVVLLPYVVFAQNPNPQPVGITRTVLEKAAGAEGAGYDTSATGRSLGRILSTVLNTFFSLLGVIFLGYMIYAGWLWMSAGGNDDQVSRAKDMIRNAIIGIIVIIAAYAITNFILNGLLDLDGGGGGPVGGRAL